ncbi:aldo/keto reductase [Haploplasma axanthum]|uniref:Oxidoreductase YdhF n=1 Tax=Haploplasma axanthum TaxID=29552 RepID=A0A449BDM2_HAPAX|nr:aldo/keto reductase [Haploplasma axanthum]VEU80528.1 Oxidoreductase YdhF [Haploplasma axanthum]
MKYQHIGASDIYASRVALGLMRIADKTHEEAVEIIKTAYDAGINFFDHADIYGGGKSELVFAKAMKELNIPREKYYLQSKVGIKPGIAYDFSMEHILKSVDEILERLETDYLDSLLLHRADMLWEPEEIAKAFKILKENGKVRKFGVSNMHQFQLSYLKSKLDFPIIANQLQFSIMHADMVSTGTFVNTNLKNDGFNAIGIIDYLREHNITIQAWSPFQYGRYEGVFIDNDKFPELNEKLDEIAKKYRTTKTTLSVAWILRHPANIQTIIGTMNPKRIKECAQATEIILSREEWYEIYIAAGNRIL